ncbi:MAG TPA: hypothetical protein VJ783_32155 [Pirellulales bacterium]|nr:hypothetical protein [Pirellulales bacterium]
MPHRTVEARIKVREPAGAEKRACEALAADEPLRDVLLSPVEARAGWVTLRDPNNCRL